MSLFIPSDIALRWAIQRLNFLLQIHTITELTPISRILRE